MEIVEVTGTLILSFSFAILLARLLLGGFVSLLRRLDRPA
jgi:hypothetical protein